MRRNRAPDDRSKGISMGLPKRITTSLTTSGTSMGIVIARSSSSSKVRSGQLWGWRSTQVVVQVATRPFLLRSLRG